MKKFFSKVSVLSVAGMLASGVAFAGIDVSNETTGSNSDNHNIVDADNNIDEDVTNSASISNSASATTDTGHNHANDNTGGGDVDAGDADINGEVENDVNSAAVDFYTEAFGDVDMNLENDTTGSQSTNTNDIDANQKLDVDLSNSASLTNSLGLTAQSGYNTANDNTGGGDVRTGKASIDTAIMNTINAGVGYSSGAFGDVRIDALNKKTGSNSDNHNIVDANQTIDLDVTNSASVSNTINATTDTGHNHANDNTGGGKVNSGDASAKSKIENSINQGGSYSVELPDVDVNLSNDTTGSHSTNTNDIDASNKVEAKVSNSASVTNSVSQDAKSGNNTADDNTGGGDVTTGDASVDFHFSNTVN
jgi:hypothetical protein